MLSSKLSHLWPTLWGTTSPLLTAGGLTILEFGPNVGLALLGVESQICADDTLMDELLAKL